MNIVISDPKSGKAVSQKTEEPVFLNKTIGEEVDLGNIGLAGYKGKITGGSDKQGFPMRKTLQGAARKKLLLRNGIGFKTARSGEKRRKSVRGNTIGTETMQLNIVITKQGEKKLEELFKTVKEEPKDEKESAKERMVKESLENVGNVELAEEAKKVKGKVRK